MPDTPGNLLPIITSAHDEKDEGMGATGLHDPLGKPASPTLSPRGETPDPASVLDVLRDIETRGTTTTGFAPQPLDLDFTRDPEPPDYLVDRLIERQTVNVLSGDTGAGKSLVTADLIVAMLTHRGKWLGRAVNGQRVLVVDEENPSRIVTARLRAIGLSNEHRESLRYFNRQGFAIGDEVATQSLRVFAEEFRPDLIVIDTAAAATNADVNDNDAVARLFTAALRPLATDLNAAVLLLHHERKPQPGQSRSPGQSMMGARQWAGQADAHVSLRVAAPLTEEPADDGTRRLRSEFVMQTPKVRDGEPDIAHLVVVTSTKDELGRLLSLTVSNGGVHEREPSKRDVLASRIPTTFGSATEMTRAEIATALDVDDDATFDRALRAAVEAGGIRRVRRGVYGPAPTTEPKI